MTEFLIKSTVAMGVLLGLYYILFEKEKMHLFNRFYLLSALVFSLALPFITIPVYIEAFSTSIRTSAGTSEMIMLSQLPYSVAPGKVYKPGVNYIPYFVWSFYSIVTLLMALRFAINLRGFIRKLSANEKIQYDGATLILLNEKVLPHTFLNYIFVNREQHEAKRIEDELYTHEYTHVKQKHTLDILFIEALKTLFWFNPLLYFYKRAIQLNHEFLADKKVIDTTANTVYYQNLLLEKAIVGTTFPMASNLTFSLTKKRFLMMTKTTSTTKAGFLKLAIAPVITALLILFCTKTIAQETLNDIPREKIKTLDVYKNVTQQQVDSLRKANPKVYKSKNRKDYAKTDVSYTDKNGKPANKKFFVEEPEAKTTSRHDQQLKDGLSGIPSDNIKSMSVYKNLTQTQIDSLRQSDPKAYTSTNPRDYGMISIQYTDEKGNLVKKRFFVQE